VSVSGTTRHFSRILPWPFGLYAAASLLHFAHNAERLAQYPNLPPSWSAGQVYAAWGCLMTLGVVGYGFYVFAHRGIGLTILGVYACLGYGGLLHYTRAPMGSHSAVMNITIFAEAAAGTLLLTTVVALGFASSQMPPNYRWSGP
jgi:hypothetical protein